MYMRATKTKNQFHCFTTELINSYCSGEQLTMVQVTIKEMIQDKGNNNEQRLYGCFP